MPRRVSSNYGWTFSLLGHLTSILWSPSTLGALNRLHCYRTIVTQSFRATQPQSYGKILLGFSSSLHSIYLYFSHRRGSYRETFIFRSSDPPKFFFPTFFQSFWLILVWHVYGEKSDSQVRSPTCLTLAKFFAQLVLPWEIGKMSALGLNIPPTSIGILMLGQRWNGEPSSAKWQHWSRMKDVLFCFEKKLPVKNQNNSFSSGTSIAT